MSKINYLEGGHHKHVERCQYTSITIFYAIFQGCHTVETHPQANNIKKTHSWEGDDGMIRTWTRNVGFASIAIYTANQTPPNYINMLEIFLRWLCLYVFCKHFANTNVCVCLVGVRTAEIRVLCSIAEVKHERSFDIQ